MRSVSKLQYCMWPRVVEPVPSICSVWANACTRTSLAGATVARVRHRKQSCPSASITNPAHSSLCMHTENGFCSSSEGLWKRGLLRGQPASWSQRNVSFFPPPDCFCFLVAASSTATIIVISAASCRRKTHRHVVIGGGSVKKTKPWACGGDNLVVWAQPESSAAALLTDWHGGAELLLVSASSRYNHSDTKHRHSAHFNAHKASVSV